MDQRPNPENPVRFGVFEVDLVSGELRKRGVRLRLAGQPFQVLALLIRNPGRIVEREELKQALWADDTFVDFENGMNTAIRKIRLVLDDSADSPRYVETLPRRGYRFIAHVEGASQDSHPGAQAAQKPAVSPVSSTAPVARGWQHLPWFLFGLTAVALLAILYFGQAPIERPLRRFAFAPKGLVLGPVISPDGRHIAYATRASDESTLWVQDLDQDEPRQLVGPGNYSDPFWSPDSNFVAFRAAQELRKVSVQGGPTTALGELPGRTGSRFRGTWSPDGNLIVFGANSPQRLYQVPAQGGTPELLFEPEESERQESFSSPHFLPNEAGSRRLLFVIGLQQEARVVAQNLDSGRREVLATGDEAFYCPTGHIVYQTAVGLWALPFSVKTLTTTGEPFPIAENAFYPSVASDGTLLYRKEEPVLEQLVWRDRGGKKVAVIGRPQAAIRHPVLSAEGRRVAVRALENGSWDIWIHEVDQPLKIRLTFDPANEQRPSWTPNGDKITFSSNRNGNHDIFVKSADAGGEAEALLATPVSEFETDWSPDGKYVVGDDMDGAIWYLQSEEGAIGYEKVIFLDTRFREIAPDLSPDGRFLAYQSDESGKHEVYVRPFPEGRGKWPVSTQGGRSARWRRDGEEIFYVERDSLMAASVTTSPSFSVGSARRLFDAPDAFVGPGHFYDVSADGQRFVMVETLAESPPPLIRVVQNWYEGFR